MVYRVQKNLPPNYEFVPKEQPLTAEEEAYVYWVRQCIMTPLSRTQCFSAFLWERSVALAAL